MMGKVCCGNSTGQNVLMLVQLYQRREVACTNSPKKTTVGTYLLSVLLFLELNLNFYESIYLFCIEMSTE